MRSAIYRGSVMHRRVRPKLHHLRYDVFYLLLDLDEAATLGLKLMGRWRPFAFYPADHGRGGGDLKQWVIDEVARAGVSADISRVSVLCLPRVFGFVFNPISVYFCETPEGDMAAILYEVNNTFGGRHFYLLPAGGEQPDGRLFQSCAKRLFVSPFNGPAGSYRFALRLPGAKVALSIDQRDEEVHVLQAAFAGRRTDLTDAALMRMLLLYPFLTLKVVAGIHWEALKLWLKGVPLHKRPGSPDTDAGNKEGGVAKGHLA